MTVRKPLVVIAGRVQELPVGDAVAIPASNGGVDPIIASFSGAVQVATGTARYYHPSATTITSAYLSLGTASSSGSVVVVVKLNGSTLTTLTLTSGSNLLAPVTLSQALTPSDYLTIDVTGAGTGAADLNVYLVVDTVGGAGGAYGNLDNGTATSTFGGITPIDCGAAT